MAENLAQDMSDLMHDYEVVSRCSHNFFTQAPS